MKKYIVNVKDADGVLIRRVERDTFSGAQELYTEYAKGGADGCGIRNHTINAYVEE